MIYNVIEGASQAIPGRDDADSCRVFTLINRKGFLVMDVNTLVQVVGSLGFPIAACCILFYYLNQERESHKEEMNSVTRALNDNTSVMIQLKEMIQTILGVKSNE